MEKKTKKRLIIDISLTAILGVIGYYAWKKFGGKITGQTEGDSKGGGVFSNNDPNTQQNPVSNKVPTPSSSSSQSSANRPDDILAFQKFANSKGYTPKLVEDGLWGPKTSKAWKKWGSSFKTKEAADKASGELTGQLKVIYENINSADKPKIFPRNHNGKGNQLMVEATGNNSGTKYYWTESGIYLAYNPTTKKWFQGGNYANNGKTLILTSGTNKGKTVKGSYPVPTAYSATQPMGEQVKTLTNSQVNDIVAKMYYAMKGGGTYENTFMNQWNRMKTLADWSAVYHTFGTKDGENLWQWMDGDFGKYYKLGFNKWFKDRGSNNRFSV